MATSRGLNEFAKRMAFIAEKTGTGWEKVIRRVGIVVARVAITATPVDTGHARRNWNASFGAPNLSVEGSRGLVNVVQAGDRVNIFSANRTSSAAQQAATSEAISKAEEKINQWKLTSGVIYIANGVGYIAQLDRGYSQQAPKGMSRLAVQAGRAELKRLKVLPPGVG